ncbi:hypothetical protein LY90DRAFT_430293 [Neocallimastix californiae]|uniref:Calponin-homology (CH) domain-containing protein n=1 Tax=Neocallimastix californiae TaxID=1754190 RepID=A0A1Y2AL14_9FUNG|nr:hypothetical protein LY90DRAFT_430293 [Neocallimastix californiae]|eukprot:ORY22927.1 hypothetical protein LY90DRAFT_430293 [Neocallimastix californiae]
MDIERKNIQAYEYLCHVEEARDWIERCIEEQIDSKTFEEQLRRGIVLAKLAQIIQPGSVKKIFDAEKLQYRHSDNINYLFNVMRNIKFPENFIFELTDLYDKKNIPKVIYCLHALRYIRKSNSILKNKKKNKKKKKKKIINIEYSYIIYIHISIIQSLFRSYWFPSSSC